MGAKRKWQYFENIRSLDSSREAVITEKTYQWYLLAKLASTLIFWLFKNCRWNMKDAKRHETFVRLTHICHNCNKLLLMAALNKTVARGLIWTFEFSCHWKSQGKFIGPWKRDRDSKTVTNRLVEYFKMFFTLTKTFGSIFLVRLTELDTYITLFPCFFHWPRRTPS